jgi:phospholipid/cholesterol/gamma-HCH transport system substrate-binding protein
MRFKTEAKIGIIVLSTIAVVIWGINFLKGRNILKRTDVYYAVYEDVAGLKMSGSVILSGFKVGVINTIEFHKEHLDKVIVAFVINGPYEIPKNSIAQIYNSDIMGTKVIRIIPSAEKEFYNYGDTLPTSIDPDLITKIQDQISPLVSSTNNAMLGIDTLLTSINQVLDPATRKKVQSALINLESTSESLSRQLSPGGNLDKTFSSLKAFTMMLDSNKEKLSAAFANLENITDSVANSNLTQAISNINATFGQSQILLKKINNGEGSLGLLATNDSLYTNLVSAGANLSILLEDMLCAFFRFR